MTVGELIEKLQKFPDFYDVLIQGYEVGEFIDKAYQDQRLVVALDVRSGKPLDLGNCDECERLHEVIGNAINQLESA